MNNKQSTKKSTTKKVVNTSVKKDRKNNNEFLDKLKEIFNKVKNIVVKFFKLHWDILLINVIAFILTVFVESQYIDFYNIVALVNAIIFVAIPTAIISYKRNIKTKDLLISIPFLYILFLIFLDYCTIRELYGINTINQDSFPNYIDALMTVFMFTFFEYITLFIVNKIKKKKEDKKVQTKKKIKK